MRINNRLAVHKWFPVFTAMPGMIQELYANKEELGFLSMESYFGLRTTAMIQYWRSLDDLISYAYNEKHMAAWKKTLIKKPETIALSASIMKRTKSKKGPTSPFM
jgi:hypothetical protein